jgi:uncharacterized protein YjbI with pentapeptide repeats
MPSAGRKPGGEIKSPQRPRTSDRLVDLPEGELAVDARYENFILAEAVLAGQSARDVTFDRVWFERVRLNKTHLPGVHVSDGRFAACDLAEANWDKAFLTRVELTASRLLGFRAIEGRIRDAVFTDCTAPLALFFGTSFRAVRFTSCVLTEASFQEADLAGVIFDRCDLREANFHGATLAGADLRGSRVEGIRAGIKELQGAIVDPVQAAQLAGAFGLVVRWDE